MRRKCEEDCSSGGLVGSMVSLPIRNSVVVMLWWSDCSVASEKNAVSATNMENSEWRTFPSWASHILTHERTRESLASSESSCASERFSAAIIFIHACRNG